MKFVNTLEPIGLRAQLELSECSSVSLQWVPYVNLCVLAFGMFLLSSKWLCPPGIPIETPHFNLSWSYQYALPAEEVLMVDAQARVFFRHHQYDFSQRDQAFSAPIPRSLLLRLDKHLPFQQVLDILSTAKEQGITSLQVAVEPEE